MNKKLKKLIRITTRLAFTEGIQYYVYDGITMRILDINEPSGIIAMNITYEIKFRADGKISIKNELITVNINTGDVLTLKSY